MGWYLEALKKYAVFGGRSRRKEYWYFVLFSVIVSLVLSAVDALLGTFSSSTNVGLLGGIVAVVTALRKRAAAGGDAQGEECRCDQFGFHGISFR